MRKGTICLTTASLIAGAFVVATPVLNSAPADDITVVGEAILATPMTAATAATVTNASLDCTDTAYVLEKWRLSGTYTWSYNPANAPAAIGSTAATAIYRATANLIGGYNRCGTRAGLPLTHAYQGSAVRAAQISATATCAGNDGVNVTSWGVLPTNTLAYTCTYYKTSTGTVVSSDMLLNSTHKWFTGTVPTACVDSFDLESVVAHERGHTAGLSHVDQTTHSRQTMSPRTMACTTHKRLLGSGDMLGMRSLTGTR
ncbi:matrixin family metalloprotease [Actinophytocola sp.]|uniref:matrixin family metalloprotease n=1 Tax=Actinophytocola sp. TaxID=1872138 RepID=UPI002ED35BC7